MDKVLLCIHVPSVKTSSDAFVPLDVPVAELTPILADGFRELSGGKYEVSKFEMLSLQDPKLLLDPRLTLRDYGVEDGMHLFLI